MTEVNPLLNSTIAGQIAQKLDAADGTKDGKINASIWNEFAQEHGGKTIKESIDVESAMNSITTYAVRGAKPAGKSVDDLAQGWLDDIKTKTPAETDNADSTEGAGSASPAEEADEAEETTPAAEDDTTEDTGNTTTSENSAKEAKAKEMGLRTTNNERFYYSDTEKMHYRWDSEKQTFVKMPGVSFVEKDGTYRKDIKNKDGSTKRIFYSADDSITHMQARANDINKIYAKASQAAQKLGLRETNGTNTAGIYYDEQTKLHYKWNAKKHVFEALDKDIVYVGIDGQTYKNTYQSNSTTDKYGIKTETVTSNGRVHKAVDASGVSFDYSRLPNDNKIRKTFKDANNFLIKVANMNPKPAIQSGHDENLDYDWKGTLLPDGIWIQVNYDKNGEITDILILYDTTPDKRPDGSTNNGYEVLYTKDKAGYNTNHNSVDFEGFITSGYDFEKLKAIAEKIFG